MARVNAVVLGGGNVDRRFQDYPAAGTKGLIPLGGKPCAQHVLEALRNTPEVDRLALVGPRELLDHPCADLADVKLDSGGSIVDKLIAATREIGDDRKLLMVTCDIPLATSRSLSEVIAECPEECAAFHPLVERSAAERDFPHHKWLFIKLREGEVVTTNVALLDPGPLLTRSDLARTVETLRQHPVRFALRWGMGFLLRYKLGLLTLRYCERFFSHLLGAACHGMICRHTGLAMDLDRPEDIPMLEQALGRPAH